MARTRNNKRKQSKGNESPKSSQQRQSNGNPQTEAKDVNKESPDNTEKDKECKTEVTKSSIPTAANDPEWYNSDPQLLKDAASIPFSTPFGADLDLLRGVTTGPGFTGIPNKIKSYVPGICTLRIKPTFGASGDKTSPVNVCANALYTHVRYVNSGRKNYDPADLFLYAAAFGDIYSFIVWCSRLYNYAFMYSQRNYYIGRDLIFANHVDAQDLVRNLANFRYWINSIINKVASFAIPADIKFFKRRVFMYGNYYLENPYGNVKDQLYQFAPEGFYHFDFDSNGAGKLAYRKIIDINGGKLLKLEHIKAYFEQVLMGNITGDEDFGLMSGDILKAYGTNILGLSSIGEDGGLLPVFDPYVLSQFKNARVFNVYRQDTSKTFKDMWNQSHIFGDLEQNTKGLLISCESMDWDKNRRSGVVAAMKSLISVESATPNEGDVIEATRLMPSYGLMPNGDGGAYFYGISTGTEVVVEMHLSIAPSTSDEEEGSTVEVTSSGIDDQDGDGNYIVRKSLGFKYCPLLFNIKMKDSGEVHNVTEVSIDSNVDNYTLVDAHITKRLHEVALLSLFYVPGVAKLI